mmetsp:Transcript_7522/g.12502  ORF Transcript_7522/g.12502 Transcript_7522/m.12502 type:complete len:194 (-) Transcript_7522:177-758(-)
MNEEAYFRVERAVARSEGLHAQEGKTKGYLPLFKHPLPVSETRFLHEDILRKVLSCKLEFQGMAAITKGDAWVLEEVYMRGGPATLTGKNGSQPIHLAVTMNSIDCVMVLINIGVDLDAVNSHGFTARFLAHSRQAKEIEQLLIENEAKYVVAATEAPDSTILDVIPERGVGSKVIQSSLHNFLGLPSESSTF